MVGPGDLGGAEPPDTASFFAPPDPSPPSVTAEVSFGAQSRCGPTHAVNEDHYLILRLGRHQETLMTSLPDEVIASRFDESGYAMVVADGMGGSGSGEAASHLAIATLVYLTRYFGKWNLRIDDSVAREIMARAERFYRHVDNTVVYERLRGALRPGQTTLTAVFGAGRDLFFAHVGHSRSYLLRHGLLLRLTRDQTVGSSRSAPPGPLVDVNYTARDLRHILTNTIGMGGTFGPMIDIERIQVENGDRVLVCTNGLTDVIGEEVITHILESDETPQEQSGRLVEAVTTAGGEDDVTALVAQYHLPH